MNMSELYEKKLEKIDHITGEDVKKILNSCKAFDHNMIVENYSVCTANSKMLGFICDYWRLQIQISKNNEKKMLSFFIKAVSRSNASKATMVKEYNLFEKEVDFYTVIKKSLDVPGLKPWSAALITVLRDAIVFEDLNAMQYKLRNKLERFDTMHTLQALRTLSRFHASSFVYEINKSNESGKPCSIEDLCSQYLDENCFQMACTWYEQCTKGGLEAVEAYSKYNGNVKVMNEIKKRWIEVFESASCLSKSSPKRRNVICHRDLWNNNILFHYKKDGESYEPDDCLLVDFQAIRCQPPAADVMLLLYCNLEPRFRENNMSSFLDYYYQELKNVLNEHNISIKHIVSKEEFLSSAEDYRQWAAIVCACLMPLIWIDDDLVTIIFGDTERFQDILLRNKGSFIKKMMNANEDYKVTVMEIFEEIVERYCLS